MPIWSRAAAPTARISTGIEAMQEAMPSLKPDRIAGVGGLATRHDSMAAGEAGADYVLFGEPDATRPAAFGRGDRRAPAMVGRTVRAALRRLCSIARGSPRIRGAGADFVLVGDFIWADPRGAAAALKDAEQVIRQAHAAAPANARAEQG